MHDRSNATCHALPHHARSSLQHLLIPHDHQVQAPPPAHAAQQAMAKPRPRQQHLDSNVEKEVDRIIDSQDNEYVLSRPK